MVYNKHIVKKKQPQAKAIKNRRASYDYALDDSLLVGLELTGREVKNLRLGHGHLQGAYVTVKDNQLWLVNGMVGSSNAAPLTEEEQTRTRRLLAKRREIDKLIQEKQQGKTIVPIELLTGGRYIKLRISAGRGKHKYDKRQVLKKRDEQRTMQAATRLR